MATRLVVMLGAVLAAIGLSGCAAAARDQVTLKIEGLTATGCSSPAAVQGTILRAEGVTRAEVSAERGEAVVEFDPARVDLTELVASVERFCLVRITRPAVRRGEDRPPRLPGVGW